MAKKSKRKAKPQRFEVEGQIENVALTRATSSVKFKVFDRGRKIGELQVGRGSIFWWGPGKKIGTRLRWNLVAEALNHLAYG